jgi:hypothetical protein
VKDEAVRNVWLRKDGSEGVRLPGKGRCRNFLDNERIQYFDLNDDNTGYICQNSPNYTRKFSILLYIIVLQKKKKKNVVWELENGSTIYWVGKLEEQFQKSYFEFEAPMQHQEQCWIWAEYKDLKFKRKILARDKNVAIVNTQMLTRLWNISTFHNIISTMRVNELTLHRA